MAAINATRRKHLLQPFEKDPRLQQAAQNHADWLARTGEFGHEFGGETLFPRRIAAVGFEGSAGENLGVNYGSIEAAIEGWLEFAQAPRRSSCAAITTAAALPMPSTPPARTRTARITG